MRSFHSLSSVLQVSCAGHGQDAPIAMPLRRALVGMATIILLAVVGLAGVAPVAAQDRPPGGVITNPVVRAIDLASPAVVRIATLYSAHLRLTACGVTTSLPASGAYTIGGLGSGAFVSANGDILTADHVVDIDPQSLDSAIFTGERVSNDVADFLNAACHPSVPVTPDDVANGIVQFNGLPFSTSYSAPKVLVWRSTSYSGAVSGGSASDATTQLSGLMKASYKEATVVKTSSFTQDDVALIHVGQTDTPSIQLDPSTELAVEDGLTVIGFPGNGDVNGDPTNLLTPSVNNVNVSAIKHNDNGSQLIQVGGNVEHGDSGGPALDAAGHIIGIVSFGGSDSPGITAFLRSSDSVLTLMRAANIDTKPGAFQKLWQKAFAAYADTTPGHWHTASREMDALIQRYPDFHGLDPYRSYADAAAVRESSTTPAFQALRLPLPLPIIGAIATVVLALLLLLIIVSSVRRRARRRARQQVAAAQPTWSSAGPQPGYDGAGAQSGYNGYNGSPYGPTYASPLYSIPALPTRLANGQPQPSGYPEQAHYQQAHPQPYQQPYPPAAPVANAPSSASQLPGYHLRANSQVPQSGPSSAPAPSQASLSQTGSSQNGAASVFCMNGHQMPPGEPRCPFCGADRAQPAPSAPPWGQTW